MKKLLFISAVVVFVATSCKKDQTCECTDTYTYGGVSSTTVTTYKAKSSKKDAAAWCENSGKGTVTINGVAYTGAASTEVCKIK